MLAPGRCTEHEQAGGYGAPVPADERDGTGSGRAGGWGGVGDRRLTQKHESANVAKGCDNGWRRLGAEQSRDRLLNGADVSDNPFP